MRRRTLSLYGRYRSRPIRPGPLGRPGPRPLQRHVRPGILRLRGEEIALGARSRRDQAALLYAHASRRGLRFSIRPDSLPRVEPRVSGLTGGFDAVLAPGLYSRSVRVAQRHAHARARQLDGDHERKPRAPRAVFRISAVPRAKSTRRGSVRGRGCSRNCRCAPPGRLRRAGGHVSLRWHRFSARRGQNAGRDQWSGPCFYHRNQWRPSRRVRR